MSDLSAKTCVACRGGVPTLKGAAIATLLDQLSGWQVIDEHHLAKRLTYPDFVTALDSVNRIGAIAEEQGHHPDIHFTWGRVDVDIWTHKIDGLTESDFILAAKIDDALGVGE